MNDQVLVRLEGVSKSFDGEPVLRAIDLDIHDKEFFHHQSREELYLLL